jgi:hypothetical protein
MAKIMDEIVQALQKLGGQARSTEIIDEIEHLRNAEMSSHERRNFYTYLQTYSTKFKLPNGDPYFYKVSPGVWATKDGAHADTQPSVVAVQLINNRAFVPETIPFEVIANSLKTIKEYRDYYDPQRPDWVEYIYEIFHVLGFSTQRIDTRLFLVKDMGGAAPQVIVLFSFPVEDETFIASDISWDSYLRFAASHYQVKRGILTNGLKLQVVNYENHSSEPQMCWSDLDGIIREQKLESFFSIYKAFSSFRHENNANHRSNVSHDDTPRRELVLEFWQSLLEQARTFLPNFSKITPGKDHWLSVGAGKSNFHYSFVIRLEDAQIELYIDQKDQKKNKRYFDILHSHKERIEQEFGDHLDWQRLDDKRACRVRYVINTSGLSDRENWPQLQMEMIEAMIQLQGALQPEIPKLK